MRRTLVPLLGFACALSPFFATTAVTAARPAPAAPDPAPGPGAVIAMHRELFAAMDRGDVEKALTFLHADMNMKDPYRQRPCTLYLVADDGTPLRSEGCDESRSLFTLQLKNDGAARGTWKTTITSAHDDCFSSELTWCTLEFERTHVVDGRSTTRRYRSTTLAAYDGGWKMS